MPCPAPVCFPLPFGLPQLRRNTKTCACPVLPLSVPGKKIEKRRRQFRCRSDTPHGRWHELAVHSAISTRGVVIAMSESKNIDAVPCTSRFRDWRGFLFFLCVCMQASEPVRLIWNAGKRKKEFLPNFAGIRTISCEIPVDLFAFSMAPDGS